MRELPLRANSRSPLQEEYDSEWDHRSRRSACISRLVLRIFPREAELAARSATGLCQGQRLACVADWLIFPPAKQPHFRFGSFEGRVHGLGRRTKDVSLRRPAFLIQAALPPGVNGTGRTKCDWPPKVTGVRSTLTPKWSCGLSHFSRLSRFRSTLSCFSNSYSVFAYNHYLPGCGAFFEQRN